MGKILSDTSKIRSLTAQRMSAASGRITDVDVAMDLMIHDVEVIQSLVRSPVINVQAAAVKTSDHPEGKDYITAVLEFANGVTANITASRITPGPGPHFDGYHRYQLHRYGFHRPEH